MSASIATTFFHTSNAQMMLEMEMEQNRVEVLAMTPLDWLSVLQDHAKQNPAKAKAIEAAVAQTSLKQYWNTTLSPNIENYTYVMPSAQLGTDLYNLGRTINALGVAGTRISVKEYKGKPYLIFKGKPGLRNVIKGTRYLAANPQIVQLGLGMKGLKHVAKGGFILGMVVSSGVEIADFFYKDEKTMYDLVGGIGVEAVKAGLGALAAVAAGALAITVTSVAIAPLIAAAAAAFYVGIKLSDLDNEHQIKKKVSEALKLAVDNLEPGYYAVQESALVTLAILSRDRSEKTDAKLREWDQAIKNAFRLLMRR
jgi:hypothetical protein